MPDATPPIQVAKDVLVQPLGDEAVLLNLNNDHYYGLDDVGTRMWALLAEHGDPEAVIRQLLLEYEADEPTLRRDLAALIDKLEQAGLITRART
jgi:hypothetical protein